ncbi:MAG: prolyl oligopeptidase family serine peptidase [Acidobacteria bacterium]|nr:prolyl oligopeptidase family serine peptidase [Acidobacteriota bacterium]
MAKFWLIGSAALLAAALTMIVISRDDGEPAVSPLLYPPARLADVSDDYHGTTVADPYRWLEDADAPETVAWVEAQNTLTARQLETTERARIRSRLTELYNYPRLSAPVKRGPRYLYTLNDGLQNQAVLYVQEGLAGAPDVLLDPNAMSPDGTVALTGMSVSHDGRLLAYALSRSGSDRQELLIRDITTRQDRPDRLLWAKFTNMSWTADGLGFYYTRFPEPGSVSREDENYFAKVYYHRLGDPQSKDRLIFERPDNREIVLTTDTSSDGRWLVLTSYKGSSDDSEVHLVDLRSEVTVPRALFTGFAAAHVFVDAVGDRLYFRSNRGAPRSRVIAVEAAAAREGAGVGDAVATAVVVPEQTDTLSYFAIVNRQLVVVYLRNASDHVRVFQLDGQDGGEIALPALGSLAGLTGRPNDRELFLRFSSFTHAPTVYRYDFGTRSLETFGASGVRSVDPAAYAVSQVWYPSKDGTNVSMFLVHRKDLPRDGERPVFLTAYGGFNISLTPQFDPANFVWLERGGIVAVPNLRGGGEYGEAWHRAGTFERKQNVFDDFIAAGEWLIAQGYTHPARLAIEGGSNGGLLVGAVMVQRPELYGAVVCRVPVADMLRYHHFTVGRFWISEYGSADDAAQFKYLYAYSPLHNVKDGTAYPPTLVTTADTDDRVAPGMAKKFAARLQAAVAPGAGPILIRVETKAGHGGGKPVTKQIDEQADIFAFLQRYLR